MEISLEQAMSDAIKLASRVIAWFEAVQDTTPAYLEAADYKLIVQFYELTGRQIPSSVKDKLS